MSDIVLTPSKLNGKTSAPPSKSDAHRAIICAALSKGVCKIAPIAMSNDIKATINCVKALGAAAEIDGDKLIIDGRNIFKNKTASLDCFESGSTLRFFVPIAAAGGVSTELTGHGSLTTRPIGLFSELLPKAGVKCVTDGTLPLCVSGQLKSGTFEIAGNISSQFITGLLLALPLLDGDSKIVLTTKLESEGYINMTLACMKKFGVTAERTDYGWFVKGNQSYIPRDYTTDGDWSQAAFFMTAGAVSGDVVVEGVDINSTQGDKEIVNLLKRFGAEVEINENSVRVKKSELKAIRIDARNIPDLVPILSVAAAYADGVTEIYGAERLRIKESDRLKTTADMINSLGGIAEEKPDGLIIRGTGKLRGGEVNGSNDHRIVMAASTAALFCENEVKISDRESINKSFPDYFEKYKELGGVVKCQSTEII